VGLFRYQRPVMQVIAGSGLAGWVITLARG